MAVGEVLTRVFEAGTPDGKPMVLVHGLTSRADRWRFNVDALAAAGFRVFAPDLPGHGFASKHAGLDHSVPGYRDFILQFLDAIGADRAVLIGTSLGGHVVGAVTCHRPERVAAVVMIGSLGLHPVAAERVERIRTGFADMRPEAVRARLLTVFSDSTFVTEQLVREDMLVNTSPGARESLQAFTAYMATRFNGDLVADGLAALGGWPPLLLLWGEDDQSVPVELGRAAHAKLPHARLVTFARTSHTPYMERPDIFNRVVLAFLDGTLSGFASPGVTCR
jgi:pimeloyl-ACP methyl ester carboxylesterase